MLTKPQLHFCHPGAHDLVRDTQRTYSKKTQVPVQAGFKKNMVFKSKCNSDQPTQLPPLPPASPCRKLSPSLPALGQEALFSAPSALCRSSIASTTLALNPWFIRLSSLSGWYYFKDITFESKDCIFMPVPSEPGTRWMLRNSRCLTDHMDERTVLCNCRERPDGL